jgi:hypothetical protein
MTMFHVFLPKPSFYRQGRSQLFLDSYRHVVANATVLENHLRGQHGEGILVATAAATTTIIITTVAIQQENTFVPNSQQGSNCFLPTLHSQNNAAFRLCAEAL